MAGGRTWVAMVLSTDLSEGCALSVRPLLEAATSEQSANCVWDPAWACFVSLRGTASAIPPEMLAQLSEALRAVAWLHKPEAAAAAAALDVSRPPPSGARLAPQLVMATRSSLVERKGGRTA
jgi:hypothetical protein